MAAKGGNAYINKLKIRVQKPAVFETHNRFDATPYHATKILLNGVRVHAKETHYSDTDACHYDMPVSRRVRRAC